MKQGEIYVAKLHPTVGSEQDGTRPVVLISGDTMNEKLDLVIACSFTTKIKGYKACVIIEPNDTNGLAQTSEILTFQVRSISKSRLQRKLGNISSEQLQSVLKGLTTLLIY